MFATATLPAAARPRAAARRASTVSVTATAFVPPTLDPNTPSPIFGGSTGGLLRKAQVCRGAWNAACHYRPSGRRPARRERACRAGAVPAASPALRPASANRRAHARRRWRSSMSSPGRRRTRLSSRCRCVAEDSPRARLGVPAAARRGLWRWGWSDSGLIQRPTNPTNALYS